MVPQGTKSAAWKKAAATIEPSAKPEPKAQLIDGYTIAELHEIADNPEIWARLFAKIPDRVTKEPTPFEPSLLQRRMFAYYRHCQDRQAPCRMVVVKIRRGGGSTGLQALLYVHAHNYNARIGAIGTTETVSMNMFKMMRFFNDHDRYPWPKASKVLETGLMEWPHGSSWEKYTADNPESARSAGLHGYGATEVGRWPNGGAKDAVETLKSMLGAVPRRGFTVVGEESTAQGATGAFAERFAKGRWPTHLEIGCELGAEWWRKWEDETPQNIAQTQAERDLQFVRIAAAWFEDGENKAEVTADDAAAIASSLDAKELALIARYETDGPIGRRLGTIAQATTTQQLAWRRAVIATEFDGDVDGFEQENPSSPKEAFASSGRHTFSRAGCAWMLEMSKARVPVIGVLERQHDGGVVFRRTDASEAWVMMWEEPREGHRYIAGLDTCGGRSNQATGTPDYNAGLVLRASFRDDDGKLNAHKVAMSLWRNCLWDPDVLAGRMKLVSDYYGQCLVVFEVNNTGAAFRQEAKALSMNLYREERMDKATSELTEYIGWTTTKESREQLMGTLKKYIRNNARGETRAEGVDCSSVIVAQECADMIRGDDGKDQAPSGKHDDHVLALGFCLQCVTGATYYAGRKRHRRQPVDMKNWRRSGG